MPARTAVSNALAHLEKPEARLSGYSLRSAVLLADNVALTHALSKWTNLPITKVMDIDTVSRYNHIFDLVTSNFFAEFDYSVAVELAATVVDMLCVIVAPLIIFNIYATPGGSLTFEFNEISVLVSVRLPIRARRVPFPGNMMRNLLTDAKTLQSKTGARL